MRGWLEIMGHSSTTFKLSVLVSPCLLHSSSRFHKSCLAGSDDTTLREGEEARKHTKVVLLSSRELELEEKNTFLVSLI